MNKQDFEKIFSKKRVEKYFERYGHNGQLAINHYLINTALSESLYTVLSFHEVCLRNRIDRQLSQYFLQRENTADWHQLFLNDVQYRGLEPKLIKATQKLRQRNERITKDKIIAELSLGFWIQLYNARYARLLWRPLRKVFANIRKAERRRDRLAAELNDIRLIRNRIFHYEPIAWNARRLSYYHQQIIHSIKAMDTRVWKVVREIDTFPKVFQKAKNNLPQNW